MPKAIITLGLSKKAFPVGTRAGQIQLTLQPPSGDPIVRNVAATATTLAMVETFLDLPVAAYRFNARRLDADGNPLTSGQEPPVTSISLQAVPGGELLSPPATMEIITVPNQGTFEFLAD